MALDSFERFFEWDDEGKGASNWITDAVRFDTDFPSFPSDKGVGSLASTIIQDYFQLDIADNVDLGSALVGYDVKSRDAYQMIQLSLAGELANGKLVECYADAEGKVRFYTIGDSSIQLGSDLFYEIKSESKRKKVDIVMVIGYDPPPRKYAGTSFNLLTLVKNIDISAFGPQAEEDLDKDNYPIFHIWGKFIPACTYFKEGYIEYGKPEFDQKKFLMEAGIANPYNFEEVSMYVHKITVPWFNQASTNITFATTTPKYISFGTDMGILHTRKYSDEDNTFRPEVCKFTEVVNPEGKGIHLTRSEEHKFIGVRDVFIFGYRLNAVRLNYYSTDGKTRTLNTTNLIADLDTTIPEPFKLTRGTDYIIVNDEKGKSGGQKIVFITDAHPDNLMKFTNENTSFMISPLSIYKEDQRKASLNHIFNPDDPELTGKLKDGVTEATAGQKIENVRMFPLNEGQAAYVIKDIILVYDWDNPCIAVTDELNQATEENLAKIQVEVYPIIIQDLPAPIAVNGELLDPTEIMPDYDITTYEDLENTRYAQVHTQMESGDIKLTLPFANDSDCEKISSYIKNELSSEVIRQTTYTMSPNAEPELGQRIGNDGEVINSIDYSYQDGSQYIITVKGGPKWQGVSGWDTSVYQNKTEQLSLEGIITGVSSNNVNCQVMITPIGVMDCINISKQIIEKGDRVSVTIYNNPVAK